MKPDTIFSAGLVTASQNRVKIRHIMNRRHFIHTLTSLAAVTTLPVTGSAAAPEKPATLADPRPKMIPDPAVSILRPIGQWYGAVKESLEELVQATSGPDKVSDWQK